MKILSVLCSSEGAWKRSKDLSRETGIPSNYLSKILNQLGKHGLVVGRKGWGGGFRLGESATTSTILEVVEIFEGRVDLNTCVFGLSECDPDDPCSMHRYWKPVREAFRKVLLGVTIGDLCTSDSSPSAGEGAYQTEQKPDSTG